jgi:glycoprotein 6-alpha-L-fucosyltransferase
MTKDRDSTETEFFQQSLNERVDLLQASIHNLSANEILATWRHSEAQLLADQVQQDFHRIQNPPDCMVAKKLLCSLDKLCGYGCQMHHIMYCFIVAHFTNRTMILNSGHWR